MKDAFVETQNFERLQAGIQALEERGARECCYMVVDGKPGLGKTEITYRFAAENDCVFFRCRTRFNTTDMMQSLLEALKVEPARRFSGMFKQALSELSRRAASAADNNETFAVIIDEVDHISRSREHLETLRDLGDFLKIPFILVGMNEVWSDLVRFPQLTSRVSQHVVFQKLPREDVRALLDARCDCPIKDDLLDVIMDLSKGRAREIMTAIGHIENHATLFGEGQPMGIEEMEGKVLLYERGSLKPQYVRAAQ